MPPETRVHRTPVSQVPTQARTFADVLAAHDGSEVTLKVAGEIVSGVLEAHEDHVLVHLPALTHIVPIHAIQRVSIG